MMRLPAGTGGTTGVMTLYYPLPIIKTLPFRESMRSCGWPSEDDWSKSHDRAAWEQRKQRGTVLE